MTELFRLASGVSTFVKVGWACWLAWAVLQVTWFRVVRDLPDLPDEAQAPADDHATGWPSLSATSHTTLLGTSRFWEPAPADGPAVAELELATAAPSDTPAGWVELASDISLPTEAAAARRTTKRRRRTLADGSPSAA